MIHKCRGTRTMHSTVYDHSKWSHHGTSHRSHSKVKRQRDNSEINVYWKVIQFGLHGDTEMNKMLSYRKETALQGAL